MTVDRVTPGDRLVLVGAGGHASVVADAARSVGAELVGYVAPEESAWLEGVPWLGTDDAFLAAPGSGTKVLLGIGPLPARARVVERYAAVPDLSFPPVVHTHAYVAATVLLGAGAQVMAGAVVQPGASLAEHVIVNTRAVVEHGCHVGPGTHVAPGAILLGDVRVSGNVMVGAGAVVLPGVVVGEGAVIGAGAAVTRDVGRSEVVVGVPARSPGRR